jgi:hypothetical protein
MKDDEKNELWWQWFEPGHLFAQACAAVRDGNPYPESPPPLNVAMNYLMSELWDHNFTQTEIRTAFEKALADMNRYAAGYESRAHEASRRD